MSKFAFLASRCFRHGVVSKVILAPPKKFEDLDRIETLSSCKPTQKYICPPRKERRIFLPLLSLTLLLALGGAFYVANYMPDTMDDLWLNDSPIYPYLNYLVLEEETEVDRKRRAALKKRKLKEAKK